MKFKKLNEADTKKRYRMNDNPIVKKIMADREKVGAPATDKEVQKDMEKRGWTVEGNPDDLFTYVYDCLIGGDKDVPAPVNYGIRRFDYDEVADMSDKYGNNSISVYVNDEDDVRLASRVAEDNNVELKVDPSNDDYYKSIITLIIPDDEVFTEDLGKYDYDQLEKDLSNAILTTIKKYDNREISREDLIKAIDNASTVSKMLKTRKSNVDEDLDEFDYDSFEHDIYNAIINAAKKYKYAGVSRNDLNRALENCSIRIEDDENALFLE